MLGWQSNPGRRLHISHRPGIYGPGLTRLQPPARVFLSTGARTASKGLRWGR